MQNRPSVGGSRNAMNSNTPARGALVDPQTYGMLLWQSKLQEKLVQEQKEKRQRELEEQQRRIRERQDHQHRQRHQSHTRRVPGQNQNDGLASANSNPTTTPILEIPPQMFPGPAPFMITPPTPETPLSSPHVIQQDNNVTFVENAPNGPVTTTVSSPGGLQEQKPILPNLPANRIRTSVSCDNIGRPTPSLPHNLSTRLLGNMVSYQQLGGAGSPRRSPSGKLLTVLRGDPEIRYHQQDTRGFDQTIRYLMDREKVQEYKRDLDQQLEEKRKWRSRLGSGAVKEITRKSFIENGSNGGGGSNKMHTFASSDHHNQLDYTRQQDHQNSPLSHHGPGDDSYSVGRGNKSGMELAPLMRKFKSLPKLVGLSSTDVTRPFVHSPRNEFFHPVEPNEVAETLSSQLREKEWLSRRQKENERLATERHFQTWDSLWGRPGAGAPLTFAQKGLGHTVSFGNLHGAYQQPNGFNRVNLFKALHMSHQQLNRPK